MSLNVSRTGRPAERSMPRIASSSASSPPGAIGWFWTCVRNSLRARAGSKPPRKHSGGQQRRGRIQRMMGERCTPGTDATQGVTLLGVRAFDQSLHVPPFVTELDAEAALFLELHMQACRGCCTSRFACESGPRAVRARRTAWAPVPSFPPQGASKLRGWVATSDSGHGIPETSCEPPRDVAVAAPGSSSSSMRFTVRLRASKLGNPTRFVQRQVSRF